MIKNWDSFLHNPQMFVIVIIFYIGIPLSIYLMAENFCGVTRMDDTSISNPGDKLVGNYKIQYPASVKYVDVKDVDIEYLVTNSKGEGAPVVRKIPFLTIAKKDHKKTRFCLCSLRSKTVNCLLNDLQKHCHDCGNDIVIPIDELMEKFSKRFSTV